MSGCLGGGECERRIGGGTGGPAGGARLGGGEEERFGRGLGGGGGAGEVGTAVVMEGDRWFEHQRSLKRLLSLMPRKLQRQSAEGHARKEGDPIMLRRLTTCLTVLGPLFVSLAHLNTRAASASAA